MRLFRTKGMPPRLLNNHSTLVLRGHTDALGGLRGRHAGTFFGFGWHFVAAGVFRRYLLAFGM